MTKRFFKLMLIGILVLSSVLVLSGCEKKNENVEEEISKETYEKPLRSYLDGIKNKSLEQVLQAYPEFMHMENLITQENIDEAYKQYEVEFNSTDITFDYTLEEPTILEQKDADRLAGQLTSLYPDAGEIKIDKAYIITVKMKVSANKAENAEGAENTENGEETENSKTDSQDFYVYRCNGNWYMY